MIGIIRVRTSESYIVDINGTQDCVLGGLEFDGATKRNRPNLAVGGVVYCRVTEWNRFVGGKLSCINKGYNTKDELG